MALDLDKILPKEKSTKFTFADFMAEVDKATGKASGPTGDSSQNTKLTFQEFMTEVNRAAAGETPKKEKPKPVEKPKPSLGAIYTGLDKKLGGILPGGFKPEKPKLPDLAPAEFEAAKQRIGREAAQREAFLQSKPGYYWDEDRQEWIPQPTGEIKPIPGGTIKPDSALARAAREAVHKFDVFAEGVLGFIPEGEYRKTIGMMRGIPPERLERYAEAPLMRDTLEERALHLAGELVPISGAYGAGQALTRRVIPEAATGTLARFGRAALPGATAGALYEGGEAALEGKSPGEVLKSAALNALLFAGGDVALREIGKVLTGLKTTPTARVKTAEPLALPSAQRAELPAPRRPEVPEYTMTEEAAIRGRGVPEKPALPMAAKDAELWQYLESKGLKPPSDTMSLAEAQFYKTLDDIKRPVEESLIPPRESPKELVNFIHEAFNGKISKNEIRKLSYDELVDMAEQVAKEKPGYWALAKKEASKRGVDLEDLYKTATDPEHARWKDIVGLGGEAPRPEIRTGPTPGELDAARNVLQKKGLGLARKAKVLEAYPELKAEFPKLAEKIEKMGDKLKRQPAPVDEAPAPAKEAAPVVPVKAEPAVSPGLEPEAAKTGNVAGAKPLEVGAKKPIEKAQQWLENVETSARQRIQSRKGRVMSGLPVDDLIDYGVIGAAKIARQGLKFAEWSAEMVSEFGEELRPHLKAIWLESQRVLKRGEEYVKLRRQQAETEIAASVVATKTEGASHSFADPKIEARWQQANGIQKEPLITRAKETLRAFGRKLSREFEQLPHSAEFAQLRYDLLHLQKQRNMTSEKTLKNLQRVVKGFDKRDYDLFKRKVILDDLSNTEGDLPFGFTRGTLAQEKTRIDRIVEGNPKVKEAVSKRHEIWEEIKKEYITALGDVGFDVAERLNRKDYYRHQILEYVDAKQKRGFLKQRLGSTKDINTNYLEAEYEVMAQMLHDIEVAKTLKKINDKYNIRPKMELGEEVPGGYTKWQPKQGGLFYLSDSIPFRVAEKLYRQAMEQFGISDKEMRRALVKSGHFDYWVVKEEVAQTLDELVKKQAHGLISDLSAGIQQKWKVWTLISPRRFIKYNIRNLTGDVDATIAGNPASFKKVPKAVKELIPVFTGKGEMTRTMRDWYERGGMQTLLQVQEMGDVNKLKMFLHLQEKRGLIGESLTKAWQGYWKTARLATDLREAILRYANYLEYLDQMKASGGKPKNFGASIPEEIMALGDIRDRAFKLSNELLGAYDAIGVIGKELRRHVIPFWSWNEVNMRRYWRLARNMARDDKLALYAGRKFLGTAVRSPVILYNVGKFLIKAHAFAAAVQAYNYLRFPEEERDLPADVKNRLHIVLGRDKNGNVRYFSRIGALSDVVDWLGIDESIINVSDYMNGRKTAGEIAIEMAKSPVKKLVTQISPLWKMPAELLSGQQLFPDPLKPRTIHDRSDYLAKSFGLEHEFRALTGRPSRPYPETLSQLYEYKSDPEQVAYYYIQDEKRRYLKKIGKGGEGTFTSPRSEALRNLKLALRYKDAEAAEKYLLEYAALGGTREGFERSIESMHPLYGLNKEEKVEFVKSLRVVDQEQLLRAVKYYEDVFKGITHE